jgi:threonine synthase
MNPEKYFLRCVNCGKEYLPTPELYTCPDCLDRYGTLEVVYRIASKTRWIRDEYLGLWKFIDILPINEDHIPPNIVVGGTPEFRSGILEEEVGAREVWIKDDGRNPTASLKDRASIVAITKAKEYGINDVFAASTGNAASSLAGLCAPAGLKAHIYVPASAPEAKITQLLIYGAEVFGIDANYDAAFDFSLREGFKKGWYCRNSAINPYLLEGKKTAALELVCAMHMDPPDIVLVGVGDGTVYSSIHKAFAELVALKEIDRVPVIIGVQGENADAVKRAFEKGIPFSPMDLNSSQCLADSIAVGKPRDVIKACQWAKKNNGFFLSVSDEEIARAIIELARKTGVFAEPAGAISYAGLKILRKTGYPLKRSKIALMITGNGLKDAKASLPFISDRVTRVSIPK